MCTFLIGLGKGMLTHWGRVTHICVSNLIIIGSDNGLSPGRCQAIIWTNDEHLLIGPLGTNFSEILIAILIFSFKKMRLKVSSGKLRSFWVNSLWPGDTMCHHKTWSTLVHIKVCYLIEAVWCISLLVNKVIIGSDNGKLPQAIVSTNVNLSSIGSIETNFS